MKFPRTHPTDFLISSSYRSHGESVWPTPPCRYQDAFLYNTLAHDTTTPHGYQQAANVGTKIHQHNQHRNRTNTPWNRWVDMDCVKYTRHSFHFISFGLDSLLCCLRLKIHPSYELVQLCPHDRLCRATFRQRLEQHVVAKTMESPSSVLYKSMPVACHDADRLDSKVIVLWTWGECLTWSVKYPIFWSNFASLKLSFGPSSGARGNSDTSERPAACCSTRSAPETPKLKSKSVPQREHTFPLESTDKHWYSCVSPKIQRGLVILVVFQKHLCATLLGYRATNR